MTLRYPATILMLACTLTAPAAASGDSSSRTLYERAMSRERAVRSADEAATTRAEFRRVISAYDLVVQRFPASGYADNAMWQAGNLAWLAFQRFGESQDRDMAIRYLTRLKREYPSSSLRSGADDVLRAASAPTAPSSVEKVAPVALTSRETPDDKAVGTTASGADVQGDAQAPTTILIRDIKRSIIPEGMRVTVEMDAETSYRAERLDGPPRVFFDLKGTRPVPALLDATIRYSDEIVREIRLGRHPNSTTRIVFDMAGVDSYSVFTLYSPYRLVIDFKPQATGVAATAQKPALPVVGQGTSGTRPARREPSPPPKRPTSLEKEALKELTVNPVIVPLQTPLPPLPSLPTVPLSASALAKFRWEAMPKPPVRPTGARIPPPPASTPTPAAATSTAGSPVANLDGKFSLARQLGLGVARVVIDAGHGGHDPGAQANGVNEAELTLDVATRLSILLLKQPGVEVVMTRDNDVFVPLEERTAIANREGADLFLSIHANASRNPKARGVETYFLNFANNPEAEAVAARENASSGRAMHSLPDIVKAIALNNKLDESRDFAELVQRSMIRKLATRNKQLRDLGVKQAPFVVLIGASMPSVLAEISFVTHHQEGTLLKSTAYRQQIAEALFEAVIKYQEGLKKPKAAVIGLGAR